MKPEIPLGFCQCGCGARTRIARQTHLKAKTVKGLPLRFKVGHYAKSQPRSEQNYREVSVNGKRKKAHVVIVEAVLGKELPSKARVHHLNGKKWDNRHSNLVVCEDDAYHFLLHMRQRAKEACGNANWRKCCQCKTWDAPDNLYVNGKTVYHRACQLAYNRKQLAMKKAG